MFPALKPNILVLLLHALLRPAEDEVIEREKMPGPVAATASEAKPRIKGSSYSRTA